MSSASECRDRAPWRAVVLVLATALAGCAAASPPTPAEAANAATLRVCADPNNLPFSNDRGEGFENVLAERVAHELGAELAYTWWPQRRGFVRNTVGAGRCELVIGVPAGYRLLATTRPYYRSSYVFVTRRADAAVTSFDDPRLRTLRIGLHTVGDDQASVPAAQALARRHILGRLHGYPIQGDYSQPDPPRALIDAVARGEVDLAIAWGPLAGYFAGRSMVPLAVVPVSPQLDRGTLPMFFDIAMGVRRGDEALRARVQRVLDRIQPEIEALLRRYGVPLLQAHAPLTTAAGRTE